MDKLDLRNSLREKEKNVIMIKTYTKVMECVCI